jgi:hypothetical protein
MERYLRGPFCVLGLRITARLPLRWFGRFRHLHHAHHIRAAHQPIKAHVEGVGDLADAVEITDSLSSRIAASLRLRSRAIFSARTVASSSICARVISSVLFSFRNCLSANVLAMLIINLSLHFLPNATEEHAKRLNAPSSALPYSSPADRPGAMSGPTVFLHFTERRHLVRLSIKPYASRSIERHTLFEGQRVRL